MLQYLSPKYWDTQRAKRITPYVMHTHQVEGVFTTPDAPLIDEKPFHLFFFYDDMMLERPMHHLVSQFEPEFTGRGFTKVNALAWKNKVTGVVIAERVDNRSVPEWAIPSDVHASPLPLRGDLFLLKKRDVFLLDRILRNNIQFDRMLVPTERWIHKSYFSHIHDRTHVTVSNPHYANAWVYFAKPDVWNVSADSWEPLPFFKSRNTAKPRYYSFHGERHEPRR